MKKKEYLFFYGSLRKAFNHETFNKIEKKINFVGKGFVKGKIFDIGEYPGFIETSDNSSLIKGEIYSFYSDDINILKFLDNYEGYYENNIQESEYIRKKKNIRMNNDNKMIRAWIYVYRMPKDQVFKEIKSGDYLKFIKQK
jgi:gamma-glutamylcyclotransferase (GGCT)/AIG2-like uncharacterized protein YtfP